MPALRPVCPSPSEPFTGSSKFFRAGCADAPGFWLQWNPHFASIWRCAGVKAEQIASFEVCKLSRADFFNQGAARKTGWLNGFKKFFSSRERKQEAMKIVQVFEGADGFLLVVRLGEEGNVFGFVKANCETFAISSTTTLNGSDYKIFYDSVNDSMLAINSSICQELKNDGNWKRNRRLENWIDWAEMQQTDNAFIRDGFLCYGSQLLRLENGRKFTLLEKIDQNSRFLAKDDFLYVMQSSGIFEICLETGSVSHHPLPAHLFLFSDEFLVRFDKQSKLLQLYHFSLFPRQLEFVVLNQIGDAIPCPFDDLSDAHFGAAEVFLLDKNGAVWSCLLPLSEPLAVSYCPVEELEFAHIFNILGPFPIASTQFYWQRRREFADGQLCFDEAIKEALGADNVLFGPERFPPANWPALSQFCRDLFKDCAKITEAAAFVFYLLLCADEKDQTRQEIFCTEFGISTAQVLRMRLFWLIDHNKASEACSLVLKNSTQMKTSAGILTKLVQTALDSNCNFSELAAFAPGHLVSLDDFLARPSLLQSLFSEALRTNSVLSAIDGIKCLFAKMKPSDAAAQIPVPQLHLQVLNCLLRALLEVRGEQVFLSRGMELAELPFEGEIVASFQQILQETDENDQSQRKRILSKLFEFRKTQDSDTDSNTSISLLSHSNASSESSNTTSHPTDPLARFFQKNSPSSTPSRPARPSSVTTSPTGSPARPIQLRPNSPLQLPRHFPPKQPTRLSQATDEDAPVVLAESKRLSKRKASEGAFVLDDEEVGEIALFATKEHRPVPSKQPTKRRRK